MAKPAVQVVNLSKQYRIGSVHDRGQSFLDMVGDAARAPFRIMRDLSRGENPFRTPEENLIWALKDISFEVEQGGVMGIIGRNGAGKSTLLKVLTRITNPTAGYVRIKGRVGSLLEVGTGFHQELTGRENTYMSGAILGMRRSEIDRKFDEIVEFSGVARFIDTPVKRYSSGMYLRLAFAVAAHLEPDVLLVDEVLAVGDAEFQQKCLGKMGNAAEEGRTVLFVSHNMNAIKYLCDDALWLDDGQIKLSGSADNVVDTYLGSVRQQTIQSDKFPAMNSEYGLGFESCLAYLNPNLNKNSVDLKIELTVRSEQLWPRIGIGFGLTTETGIKAVWLGARITNHLFDMQPGLNHFCLECPDINHRLAEGTYLVSLWLAIPGLKQIVAVDEAAVINVPGIDFYRTGLHIEARRDGLVVLPTTIRPTEGVSE